MIKYIFTFSLAFTILTSVVAQNADSYVSIISASAAIPLNSNTTLMCNVGNAENGIILPNTLRILIGVGLNAEILGLFPFGC